MSQEFTKKIINPVVHNSEDGFVYADDLKIKNVEELNFKELTPIMNAREWVKSTDGQGIGSKAAAIQADPLSLTEIFVNNGKEETNYADIANEWLSDLHKARITRDKGLAAAIITSKDYSLLQDTVVLGESQEVIKTGVVSQQFEEVGLTNLSGGKYRDFAHDLKWHRNIPEGKSPEPSFGASTEVSITIQKHGGAVAITDRARDVINGANVFAKLVSQLQQIRLKDENLMVVQEIESNTGNTETGVDFGSRSGTPPASQQSPAQLITEIIQDFETASKPGTWNKFFTKGFVYNEYSLNDIVRGTLGPLPSQSAVNETQSGAQGFPGNVTWVRDDTFTDATKGFALDSEAIKKFRGPTRQYTITDPEKEYEKYTTKTHLSVETLKTELVFLVTGISA